MEEVQKGRFLRLEDNKPTQITFSDWTTDKYNDVLFKSYASKENGVEIDQVWTIFDFSLAEKLKKIVKGKKTHQRITVEITKKPIDEFDAEYDVKEVK